MRRGVRAGLLLAAALVVAPLILAACGGRVASPPSIVSGAVSRHTVQAAAGASGNTTTSSTTGPPSGNAPSATRPAGGSATPATAPPGTARGQGTSADPTHKAIVASYETYLVDLSGLDDTLSKGYIAPLAAVTTTRLAQASVRQAAALEAAREHGTGTLRDDHLSVIMNGPSSAVLADCQDEDHFTLVEDASGTPEPFVERGYFAGSAQMVLQDGHWLVDVFTTTHVDCAF